MTDKEIIKALECCKPNNDEGCLNCPLADVPLPKCAEILSKESVNLINRQQAEIERLEKHNKEVTENCLIVMNRAEERYNTLFEEAKEILINKARVEAIKEFWEKLWELDPEIIGKVVSFDLGELNNLVKEMVGK